MENEANVILAAVGGLVLILLAFFWSKTTQTVKIIETEAYKSTVVVQENTKEKIAQMKFEGKKLQIDCERQKNTNDRDNKKDKLKVKLGYQETLLEKEKLTQEGKTTRTRIKSDTLLTLTKDNNETKRFRVQADLLMSEKQLDFEDRQLTSLNDLEKYRINKAMEATKLKLEGQKYETMSCLEGLKVIESHRDQRLRATQKAAIQMQKEDLAQMHEMHKMRLESDERKSIKFCDTLREREREKTRRQRIRAEAEILKGLIDVVNPAAYMTGVPGKIAGAFGKVLETTLSSDSGCVVEEIDGIDNSLTKE